MQDILRNLVVPCEENPLPVSELEIDEFQFHYTGAEPRQFTYLCLCSAASCAFHMECRLHCPQHQ